MKKKLKILHIEDNKLDSELISEGLTTKGVLHGIYLVDSKEELLKALFRETFDLVLCDYSVPGFNGSDALKMVREKFPDLPFIFVSGTIGEERAVEVLKQGATDYVLKDKMEKLYPAIDRALEEQERIIMLRSMDEVIHQNEERLSCVMKATKDVVWDMEVATGNVWRNEEAKNFFGDDVNELNFDWWKEQIHPDDRKRVIDNINDVLAKQDATLEAEFRLRRGDGTYAYVSNRGFIIRDEFGKPVRMIGAFRDITELKQNIEALRESEKKLRTLFDLLPVGVSIVDNKGSVVDFNPELLRIQELSSGDLLTASYKTRKYIRVDGAEIDPSEFPSVRAMEKQVPVRNEEVGIVMKDGRITWVNLNAAPIPGYGSIIVSADITSKINAERELRESEEKYRILIDTSPDAIFMTSLAGDILFANRQAADLFLYIEAKTLLGKNVHELMAGGNQVEVDYFLENITRQETYRNLEVNLQRLDGSQFIGETSISLIKDDAKKPQGFIWVLRDITIRKQTERDLITAKEKAEEMSRLKSSFLANMSHELRTPLIGVLGFAEILSAELGDSELKKMAETILKGGKRLSDTLNLILDLSRLEADKISASYSQINVGPIVTEVIKQHLSEARQKDISMKYVPPAENTFAFADRRMLSDALSNIINNAVKYTDAGAISVRLFETEEGGTQWAVISVTDTGIGIPPEFLDVIFHEFRQVSEGYNRSYEGTGLGLTIAKKFVDLMHGKIAVTSQPEKGSVFSVYLPAPPQQKELKIKEESALNTAANLSLKDIPFFELLYVEDDPDTQELMRRLLKLSYKLDIARSAERALEVISAKAYDAFLIDINLGKGMNGIELVSTLNKNELLRRIPKIAITAHAMEGDRERLLGSGFDYYLEKPFSRAELFNMLKKVQAER